jgi:hypothetical protein
MILQLGPGEIFPEAKLSVTLVNPICQAMQSRMPENELGGAMRVNG